MMRSTVVTAKRQTQASSKSVSFFAQLVEVPVVFGVAVDAEPGVFDRVAGFIGLGPVARRGLWHRQAVAALSRRATPVVQRGAS